MRVFTLLVAIAAVAFHAWIGMRCVFTDYITVRLIGPKANGLRNALQLGLAIHAPASIYCGRSKFSGDFN